MIARIRELLEAAPFESCCIRTSDGREHVVPTAEHAFIPPAGGRVLVVMDDDSGATLSALHIASVFKQARPAGAPEGAAN